MTTNLLKYDGLRMFTNCYNSVRGFLSISQLKQMINSASCTQVKCTEYSFPINHYLLIAMCCLSQSNRSCDSNIKTMTILVPNVGPIDWQATRIISYHLSCLMTLGPWKVTNPLTARLHCLLSGKTHLNQLQHPSPDLAKILWIIPWKGHLDWFLLTQW